jgi:hypothetical protein
MLCSTGKRIYDTAQMAEDGLIETWTRFNVTPGNGPVGVYRCEDCGFYHLTSKGPMNAKLASYLAEGKIKWQTDINYWEDKFKKR